ncbi:unnamed protein product, partial [Durusdinium trenchii]
MTTLINAMDVAFAVAGGCGVTTSAVTHGIPQRRQLHSSPAGRAGRAAWLPLLAGGAATAAASKRRAVTGLRASKVVLMGDSVLDNFFWLQTPTRHLRVQLQEQLAKSRNAKVKQLQCVNLAVDQMTTFDFVERKPQENPWETYAKARKLVAFEDDEDKEYVVDSDGVIRSVENLRRLEDVKWVVLSLGGN